MSTIKLYRNCRILEEKNFQVDNIETYLSSLVSNTFNNAQYIKQGLDTEVKVVLDQDYLSRETTNNFNYCRIDNGGGSDDYYYYFIRKMVWTAKNCIKLELRLDTLNTFNGCYQLTDKTTINRMHKDRLLAKHNLHLLAKSITLSYPNDFTTTKLANTYQFVFKMPSTYAGATITAGDLIITLFPATAHILTKSIVKDEIDNQYTVTFTTDGNSFSTMVCGVQVSSKQYVRNVDYEDEGITPVLYKKSETVIQDDTKMKWYLMYKSATPLTPSGSASEAVHTYLIPEQPIRVNYKHAVSDNSLTAASQISETGKAYYVLGNYGSGNKNSSPIEVFGSNDNGTTYTKLFEVKRDTNWKGEFDVIAMMQKSDTKINIKKCVYDREFTSTNMYVKEFGDYDKIKFGTFNTLYYKKLDFALTSSNILTKWSSVVNAATSTWTFTGEAIRTSYTTSIDDIDLTDPKIVKIIELPYAPAQIKLKNDNTFDLDNLDNSIWEFQEGDKYFLKKGTGVNIRMLQNIKPEDNILNELYPVYDTSPSASDLRDDKYESKLLNSNFYLHKYVYDSFSYPIQYENCKVNPILLAAGNWTIDFVVGNACNTKFLFNFNDLEYKQSTQDYDTIMVVGRNNEVAISNSTYINYLKVGYNYDQKSLSVNTATTLLNAGTGVARGAVSGALTGGESGGAVGAVVGAGLGAAASLTNTVISITNAERNLAQKRNEMMQQAGTVIGADDLDLLRYYANDNKMKLCNYEVSENTKHRIADLFYYCGYACNYQAVPNTTSRYWFNFIQCNPVYDESISTAKLNKEMKTDLSEKYQQGVTVLHNHGGNYDFAQIKENWETWLLN